MFDDLQYPGAPPEQYGNTPAVLPAFIQPSKVPMSVSQRAQYLRELCDDDVYQAVLQEHLKTQVSVFLYSLYKC